MERIEIPDTIESNQLSGLNEDRDAILRCIADGITVQNNEGKIIFANNQAALLCGFASAEELLLMPVEDALSKIEMYDEQGAPFNVEDLPSRRLMRGEQNNTVTIRFLNKLTNKKSWATIQSTAIYDVDGSIKFIINSFNDITKIKAAETKLRLSENRHRLMIEQSPLSTQIISPEGFIVQTNRAWENLFGVTLDQIKDYNILKDQQLIDVGIMPFIEAAFKGEISYLPPVPYSPDRGAFEGKEIWTRAIIYPVKDPEGKIIELVLQHENITDQKTIEDELRKSLKEKEILLKEIHHRVKNNLQIISSLLSLKAQFIQNPEADDILRDSRDRIKAMALIHQKLYETNDFTKINFVDYIRELTAYLIRSYNLNMSDIGIKINVDEPELSLDQMINLGIMLNELVSNSVKYAFNRKENAELLIELRKLDDKKYTLSVKDNGAGLPEGINIENPNSLGLQIVTTIAEQLNGTLEYRYNNGAEFIVTF